MSRARALLLALAGLALPVGLALGVYVASAGSLESGPTVIQPPAQIARSAASTEAAQTQTRPDTTSTTARDDDLPGKCDEPEHRLDPDCDPRTAREDDDSGRGSGSDDDSSGKGSGGGDDGDSGGHGGGSGDDSGGHGSDD